MELFDDYTLSADEPFMLLYFTITNYNSIGGKDMTISIYNNAVMKNVNIVYVYSDNMDPAYLEEDSYKQIPAVETVAPQKTVALQIWIEIEDLTLDAEFISTAEKGLGFTLNAVE